jgi:hypothetical protein
MRIHPTSSAGIVALTFALTGAACTSGSTDAGGSPIPTPTSTSASASPRESPSVTKSPKPSATASPILEDGRSFVYVKRVDASAPSLTFDIALFYTGEKANQIAGERGDEVPVPNDVYIVNDNPMLRTLPFADGAQFLSYDWRACCDNYTSMTLDRWAGYVAAPTRRFHGKLSPYWITVRGGEIVKIEEQYLP